LELSAEGYSMADLAALDGSHLNSLRARMKKALPVMRQLPEVIVALGTAPENRSSELV
jgi:lambda repressor-like predicted transcriptional regulator